MRYIASSATLVASVGFDMVPDPLLSAEDSKNVYPDLNTTNALGTWLYGFEYKGFSHFINISADDLPQRMLRNLGTKYQRSLRQFQNLVSHEWCLPKYRLEQCGYSGIPRSRRIQQRSAEAVELVGWTGMHVYFLSGSRE